MKMTLPAPAAGEHIFVTSCHTMCVIRTDVMFWKNDCHVSLSWQFVMLTSFYLDGLSHSDKFIFLFVWMIVYQFWQVYLVFGRMIMYHVLTSSSLEELIFVMLILFKRWLRFQYIFTSLSLCLKNDCHILTGCSLHEKNDCL